MFDTVIQIRKTFVQANERSFHNLSLYHKIGVYLNVPPHKWDVSSKFVAVGFYSNGETLIAHGDDEPKLCEFIKQLLIDYNKAG
jgi:hypothetical protein